MTKQECDDDFLENMETQCGDSFACNIMANVAYKALQNANEAQKSYNLRQRHACRAHKS